MKKATYSFGHENKKERGKRIALMDTPGRKKGWGRGTI